MLFSPPIVQDDVSAFLPPGFKLDETTTSTTTDTSLISDILSSIEIDDSLLPKDFNFKPARPKPPRLFNSNKPSSGAGTTTTTTSTSSSSSSSSSDSSSSGSLLESLGSIEFDDASQFLPPGYNDNANKEGSGTESSSTSSSPSNNNNKKKPDNSKLPIESFFDNLPSDVDDISAFLPPGYNKEGASPESSTTEKNFKPKFPSIPGVSRKTTTESSATRSGPPPFVPKIQSFSDRYVYLSICITGTRSRVFALLSIIESNNKCFMYHTKNCLFQLPFRLFLQDQNYYRIQWLE